MARHTESGVGQDAGQHAPTGTSEFKAVALEALRLGAHCVEAARNWFNDRSTEMRNRNPASGDRRQDYEAGWPDGQRNYAGPDAGRRVHVGAQDANRRGYDGGHGQAAPYPRERTSQSGAPIGGYGAPGYPRSQENNPYPRRDDRPGNDWDQGNRGRGPRNFTRSDARITEDVNEKLADDDLIDASEINVEVKEGVVTLTGSVERRWMKHQAEDLVERCSGVKDVENNIRVARPASDDRDRGATVSTGEMDDTTLPGAGTGSKGDIENGSTGL